MTMNIFWFLPTAGDTRYLGNSASGRLATPEYLQQIAVAADTLGFDGMLIPTGSSCLDPWVTAASLIPVTKRLKFLVALRTSLGNVTASARQAATFDRASHGRLLLNVVPGGDATELAADGVFSRTMSVTKPLMSFLMCGKPCYKMKPSISTVNISK